MYMWILNYVYMQKNVNDFCSLPVLAALVVSDRELIPALS